MFVMFSSSKHIESIQQLLLELKNYYKLQKKFVYLDTAEKLTVLLSAIAIAIIMVILIALVLMYATFALAFFIGNRLDSLPMGFVLVAAGLLIVLMLFYYNRKNWIVQPLARFIARLFFEKQKGDENGTSEQ